MLSKANKQETQAQESRRPGSRLIRRPRRHVCPVNKQLMEINFDVAVSINHSRSKGKSRESSGLKLSFWRLAQGVNFRFAIP